MALFIRNVEVEQVPDDKVVEIVHMEMHDWRDDPMGLVGDKVLQKERCEPYIVHRYKPQTLEEIQAGLPAEQETFVLNMPVEVQEQLLLVYDTWEWLVKNQKMHTHTIELLRCRLDEIGDRLERFAKLPWYKRVWQALTVPSN